jgi:hypothetical protein
LSTVDPKIRRELLDLLGTFGNKGIPAINELISLTVDSDVKSYGLDIIKRIKSQTNSESFGLPVEDELSSDDD